MITKNIVTFAEHPRSVIAVHQTDNGDIMFSVTDTSSASITVSRSTALWLASEIERVLK